ncbi:hypothetical protein IIB34_03590, partial [PVC group bacterium]|nr:hypothetical protein [PVC group bacterium]
ITAWMVIEQIIKDFCVKNYACSSDDLSLDYNKNIFGFSKRGKKDLDFFYYIRNSLVHYNGAYFAYKSINHVYNGRRFISNGNEGNKIELTYPIVFTICKDIEKYSMKVWNNAKIFTP